MQIISHPSHLDALPQDKLAEFIIKRFEQLTEDTDIPPTIILVKPDDDISGSDYAFVGCDGLLSDLLEEHKPREVGFNRPYEWVSYHPGIGLYEALYLINGEDGYWIMIPEDIAENRPDLKWVLTAEDLGGLSDPQPL